MHTAGSDAQAIATTVVRSPARVAPQGIYILHGACLFHNSHGLHTGAQHAPTRTFMLGRGPMVWGPSGSPSGRGGVVRGESSGSRGVMPLGCGCTSRPEPWPSSPSAPGWAWSVSAEKALEREVEVWGVVGAWGESPAVAMSESCCWIVLATLPLSRPCGRRGYHAHSDNSRR